MTKSNFFFKEKNSLPVIELSNPTGSLEVSTYGAHILSWKPCNGKDVLWMSPHSPWEKGCALRGGIPVCFPWFGPNTSHAQWPLHGFVRNKVWDIESLNVTDEATSVTLTIDGSKIKDRYGYPVFRLKLEICLSTDLEVRFTVENTSDEVFCFENGLHTYFAADPQSVRSDSFDGMMYYDKVNDFRKGFISGTFEFNPQIEQALFGMNAPKSIDIRLQSERLVLRHDGFESAILWSPGEKAGLGNPEIREGWKDFFCLESANAKDNAVTLKPGDSHTAVLTVSLNKE